MPSDKHNLIMANTMNLLFDISSAQDVLFAYRSMYSTTQAQRRTRSHKSICSR